MQFLERLFSREDRALLKRGERAAAEVGALEPSFQALSDEELKQKTEEFKARLAKGASLDELLPEAFAAVREAARRTLSMRHFDVQIVGGYVLHHRAIAEMKTGEGKTLVATLPAYLNALEGRGVHIVTVNDYLARRDAVWMGQVYALLGLSVGIINHDASYLYDAGHTHADAPRDEEGSFRVFYEFLRPTSRREAYEADVTYGTNSEFGFDYLRDNIAYVPEELRGRERHFAIVDEIDSILIDEARTPLIISAPTSESEDLYRTFAQIARGMERGRDFTVDEKLRAIQLTDEGIERAEKALHVENIYTERGIKYVHHLETAVRAKALYHKDKEYVVRNSEVVIVDEFTGRLQPGRRWSEGLHQAIEAKEGVAIQKESRTFASITYQNYFRLYRKLSGMTGTAKTSAEEFFKVYGLETVEVPTNRPVVRKDHNDLIFQTEGGKFTALARRVKEAHERGQPVLIGTISIEKNELLSSFLTREGVPHEVLNAKNHEREGEIVADAGKRGRVTVATNMAGRGVDIKLGGTHATTEEYEEVKRLGGLFVLGTERHEARRIDNQLRGRSGRQGDPGETQFFVSLEDSLMRVFASDTIKRMMGRFGIPEDEPIENGLINRALESAQEKIEGFHFDARKHVLEYDNVLDHQRRIIYERRRAVLLGTEDEVREILQAFMAGRDDLEAGVRAKEEELGTEVFLRALRRIILQATDMLWVEHLEHMEYLRGSVNLRAYGQRDPLIEYRREGLRSFKEMEESLAAHSVELVLRLEGLGAEKLIEEAQTKSSIMAQVSPSAAPRAVQGIGRNEWVEVTNGQETKRMKYKKAEALLATGKWRIVGS